MNFSIDINFFKAKISKPIFLRKSLIKIICFKFDSKLCLSIKLLFKIVATIGIKKLEFSTYQ